MFGGATANYSGTIENTSLTPPAQAAGLESFLHGLSGGGGGFVFRATPNPTRGRVTLSLQHGATAPLLDLIDASGRRIATLLPSMSGDRAQWSFEGKDERGHPVTPGVLYARPRGVADFIARIVVLP